MARVRDEVVETAKPKSDAYVGLPYEKGFMGGKVALTRPFLRLGYVIAAPPGSGFRARPARA